MTVDEEVQARTYQYRHGDRPLDGFTIQRAAGRGGFGEVYFAVSDSGREVALKLVLTYEKIELRGISQCMNIKSPQLVTIFDVKHRIDGRPWVIMEFVSGPSLRELLDAAPSGLGAAKAAFFLREIGKGLTYLHDCGIVHRDLKPGNIFYENGCVKIGDYGLSKAMNMSQHSGQTVAVGTLHYMAPEIGEGRYDRTIDIYALGALLFEMMTGQVPFYGSSVAEVLMKHLRSEVCLDGIEEPFQSVIRKAMAKNPADRYQSVQEMVEAVFGSEAVRNSVSQFSPASLTQVAGRAARDVAGANVSPNAPDRDEPPFAWDRATARAKARFQREQQRAQERLERVRSRIAGKMGGKINANWNLNPQPAGPAQPDRLTCSERIFLAAVATTFAGFVGFVSDSGHEGIENGFFVIAAITGCIVGLKFAGKMIGSSLSDESKWVQRLALGLPAAFGAAIASLPMWGHHRGNSLGLVQACMGAMLLMDWEMRLSPARKQRVCVSKQVSAGLCALLLAGMLDCSNPALAVATVVGASVAAGLLSGWGPRRPAVPSPSPAGFQATPGAGAAFRIRFGPKQPPAPPTPPPVAPPQPVAVAPVRPIAQPARRNARSFGMIPVFIAVLLWILCLGAVHDMKKPAAVLLLFAAVAVTARVIASNRAGILSNPGSSIGGDIASASASMAGIASSVARGVASMIGSILLFAAIALALAVSINVPGFLEHGIVDPKMPYEIERAVGSPQWPRLLSEGATAVCVVLSMSSVVLLLVVRRNAGGGHIIRGLLGIAVLLGGAAAMGTAMPDLGQVTMAATPADTADQYFQRVQFRNVVQASSVFLVGAVLLGWPGRRDSRPALIPPIAPVGKEPTK